MLSAGVYVADVAALALIQRAVALVGEQFGEPQDGVERRAQFMTHRREELILELANAFGFFLRPLEDFFRPLALGDVPRSRIDQSLLKKGRRAPQEPFVRTVLAAVAVLKGDRVYTGRQLLCFLDG